MTKIEVGDKYSVGAIIYEVKAVYIGGDDKTKVVFEPGSKNHLGIVYDADDLVRFGLTPYAPPANKFRVGCFYKHFNYNHEVKKVVFIEDDIVLYATYRAGMVQARSGYDVIEAQRDYYEVANRYGDELKSA